MIFKNNINNTMHYLKNTNLNEIAEDTVAGDFWTPLFVFNNFSGPVRGNPVKHL